MDLINTNYKNILFTSSDGISVNLKVNMIDPTNLNENFLVLSVDKLHNSKEQRLFYWINNKRFTLNEFIFFALNNNICLRITDKQNNEITHYGACGFSSRIFNNVFGINFN